MTDKEIANVLRQLRDDQARYRRQSEAYGDPDRVARFNRNIDALDIAIVTFDPEEQR